MWNLIAFAALVGCVSMPLCGQSQVYYLPQVIDGAANAGVLRTTIILTNIDTANATIQISFTNDSGSGRQLNFPALGSGSQFSLSLKPGGSQILQTDGSGDGSAGAAKVSSTAALGVSTIVSAYDSNGNPLSEASASSSDLYSRYVLPIDTTNGLNTGAGIFNPSATPASLTFALFDTTGAAIEAATATIGAKGHLTRMAAGDLFPDIASFQGTLVLTASAPVAAVTIRQNPAANVYTLLDAVPQISLGLKFYLPQLADGPTTNGTVQTTLILNNLTQNPATATISLSQDNGAPLVVNIPGVDNNSMFTASLPPGGSAFFQTDGQSPYATGAATVSSTQPIAVAAVITAKDGNGDVLTETGVAGSAPKEKFLVAFDTTNNIDTGLAWFNPGSLPVTLTINQLDPSGNVVASTQSQPLAPGAHMTAYAADFFPGTSGVQGALSVTATGAAGAAVAAMGLRQNGTPLSMGSMQAAPLPATGTGISVTPTLDSKSQATAAIPPAGGTFSLTDARGNKFTLTIPPSALLNTTTITMTAITGVNGLPAGGSFNAGVQLSPDGLVLLQPALLTIKPANPADPNLSFPVGWYGAGQGLYLNMLRPQPGDLTLVLNHFSGAGIATGADSSVTAALLSIANLADYDSSEAAYWARRARADEILGGDDSADLDQMRQVLNRGYSDFVEPLMRLALQTNDDDLLQCAVTQSLNYLRLTDLLGLSQDAAIASAINSFVLDAIQIIEGHLKNRCVNQHDPVAGLQLIAALREFALLGLGSDMDLSTVENQCPPGPTLKFQSEMSGTANDTYNGPPASTLSAKIDFSVAANLVLELTANRIPLGTMDDGYISYSVSGSGPLTYTSASGTISSTVTGPGFTAICTAALTSTTGSTLKVVPSGSVMRYQWKPIYNPNIYRNNGETLCQFCPGNKFDTSPVEVILGVDPGMPSESYQTQCSAGGQLPSTPGPSWLSMWDSFHEPEGNAIINWQIPGENSFAHKDISRSLSFPPPAPFSGNENITEKTTLDINQAQQ